MRNPLPLSVAIITLNEEKNLARCLESVRGLAAEIVVVDSGSTDGTGDIAKSFGAEFVFEKWQGFVAQKNAALRRCSQPWVLCLDADEVVSPELAESIRARFAAGEPAEAGFQVNRRTFYLGRWIWHSWYPQWRLRLVRGQQARWGGRDPHDELDVTGLSGKLAGDLLHYSYKDLDDHLQRTLKYARLSARELQRAGKVPRWRHLILSPWLAFFKKLVLKQGWRDGWRGWLIAYSAFIGVFAKYAFMFEEKFDADKNDAEHPPGQKSQAHKHHS